MQERGRRVLAFVRRWVGIPRGKPGPGQELPSLALGSIREVPPHPCMNTRTFRPFSCLPHQPLTERPAEKQRGVEEGVSGEQLSAVKGLLRNAGKRQESPRVRAPLGRHPPWEARTWPGASEPCSWVDTRGASPPVHEHEDLPPSFLPSSSAVD